LKKNLEKRKGRGEFMVGPRGGGFSFIKGSTGLCEGLVRGSRIGCKSCGRGMKERRENRWEILKRLGGGGWEETGANKKRGYRAVVVGDSINC